MNEIYQYSWDIEQERTGDIFFKSRREKLEKKLRHYYNKGVSFPKNKMIKAIVIQTEKSLERVYMEWNKSWTN